MDITPLPLAALRVNRCNDRHGELKSEQHAIRWLFEEREQHMKNLAADIVLQGRIYEPPLVTKTHSSRYTVHDGNRRVACLKLLSDHTIAPTQEIKSHFEKLRSKWPGDFPQLFDCQIERDLDHVDEILFRRHTGSQSGVGQSAWNNAAKLNFIARTGRATTNVAESIEKKLLLTGRLNKTDKLPRSNLNRLLSSEEFRNAVGVSLSGGDLVYLSNPDKVIGALEKIAKDLVGKNLVLGHIWNNEGKRQYLAELGDKGLLPDASDQLSVPIPFAETAQKQSPPSTALQFHPASGPRKTLIPTDITYDVTWAPATARIRDMWSELQQLSIERFPNAVACSFRVLLEITTDHCINSTRGIGAHESDRLTRKLDQTATYLENKGLISEKYRKELHRFAHSEELISASAMHRYIHSSTYAPSPRHLTALWDTLSEFLVCCLSQGRKEQSAA